MTAEIAATHQEMTRAGPSKPARELVLTQLLDKAAARGLRIAARLVGAADADDAVQEALAKTLVDLDRIREPEAWFIRVLVNHCLGIQRRRRLWRLFSLGARAEADQQPSASGPDDSLGAARQHATLRAAVARLPAMQRTVVHLRFGEGFAIAEIAAALDISDETAKTHVARAIARLRNELGDAHDE